MLNVRYYYNLLRPLTVVSAVLAVCIGADKCSSTPSVSATAPYGIAVAFDTGQVIFYPKCSSSGVILSDPSAKPASGATGMGPDGKIYHANIVQPPGVQVAIFDYVTSGSTTPALYMPSHDITNPVGIAIGDYENVNSKSAARIFIANGSDGGVPGNVALFNYAGDPMESYKISDLNLRHPVAVAVWLDTVYVVTINPARIFVFDATPGKPPILTKVIDNIRLSEPVGVAVDSSQVYVANIDPSGDGEVLAFQKSNLTADPVRYAQTSQGIRPVAIATDTSLVYVAEYDPNSGDSILAFDPKNPQQTKLCIPSLGPVSGVSAR